MRGMKIMNEQNSVKYTRMRELSRMKLNKEDQLNKQEKWKSGGKQKWGNAINT